MVWEIVGSLVMSRIIALLGMLALLGPVSGCASVSSCGSAGCNSCGLASCSTGEVRARNPIEQLRHGLNGGGCGEMYWGEYPLRDCDTCNTRPGTAAGLGVLLGVRHHEATASCSTCGVASSDCGCGHGSHMHGETMLIEGERVRVPAASPEVILPTTPPRPLPGPASGSGQSIMRRPTTARSVSRTR